MKAIKKFLVFSFVSICILFLLFAVGRIFIGLHDYGNYYYFTDFDQKDTETILSEFYLRDSSYIIDVLYAPRDGSLVAVCSSGESTTDFVYGLDDSIFDISRIIEDNNIIDGKNTTDIIRINSYFVDEGINPVDCIYWYDNNAGVSKLRLSKPISECSWITVDTYAKKRITLFQKIKLILEEKKNKKHLEIK